MLCKNIFFFFFNAMQKIIMLKENLSNLYAYAKKIFLDEMQEWMHLKK